MPNADANALNEHLKVISLTVAPGAHAILILDGAGYHFAKAISVPENMTLIRLPPYAPELNAAENIWAWLRANKLANRVFETWDEIVTACCNAWKDFTSNPDIVTSVTRRDWAQVTQ
jgi:transposase